MTKDKVIDKVRKLLALASSPNEAEAAAAAAKAQALLAEHNISMAAVRGRDTGIDTIEEEDVRLPGAGVPWRRALAGTLSRLYFCEFYYWVDHEYTRYVFVGAAHNRAVAMTMFDYLRKTVEREARRSADSNGGTTNRSRYITSFKNACAGRLCQRMHERFVQARAGKAESSVTGTNLPALASLYDQAQANLTAYLEQKHGNLNAKRTKLRATDAAGYHAGRAAGDRIGLDTQVGKGGGTQLLEDRINGRRT